jgi:hypothetical protein
MRIIGCMSDIFDDHMSSAVFLVRLSLCLGGGGEGGMAPCLAGRERNKGLLEIR